MLGVEFGAVHNLHSTVYWLNLYTPWERSIEHRDCGVDCSSILCILNGFMEQVITTLVAYLSFPYKDFMFAVVKSDIQIDSNRFFHIVFCIQN